MGYARNKIETEIIDYIKSLGLEVHTTTKALGHQGFFRNNRIDISKNIPKNRIIPTLLHEFSHYIVYNIKKKCDDLIPIFGENSQVLTDELLLVTNFVDKNSTFENLYEQKNNIKQKIVSYEKCIKQKYPDFKRSEKFKPFTKYARFSNLRFLEKYDAIKTINWFQYKTYSIINIEKDFPDTPEEFIAYLKLKSCQRYQTRISKKINKMNKYYNEPTELFARFVESLYIDCEKTKEIAPHVFEKFKQNFEIGYYGELNKIFEIVNITV